MNADGLSNLKSFKSKQKYTALFRIHIRETKGKIEKKYFHSLFVKKT